MLRDLTELLHLHTSRFYSSTVNFVNVQTYLVCASLWVAPIQVRSSHIHGTIGGTDSLCKDHYRNRLPHWKRERCRCFPCTCRLMADMTLQLGYSALVGFGVLVLGFPLQMLLVRIMFRQRKKGVVLTDQRIRTITEVLLISLFMFRQC